MLDPVEVIDAAQDFDLIGHRVADRFGPVFIGHWRIAFAGPGADADDRRAPDKAEQVAEFRGSAVKIAGAQAGRHPIVMTIERIKGLAQFKELGHLAKRRRVVIQIALDAASCSPSSFPGLKTPQPGRL